MQKLMISIDGREVDAATIEFSFAEFARHVGKDRRTIYDWRDKGMPVNDNGKIPLMHAVQWALLHTGCVTPDERAAALMERLEEREAALTKRIEEFEARQAGGSSAPTAATKTRKPKGRK